MSCNLEICDKIARLISFFLADDLCILTFQSLKSYKNSFYLGQLCQKMTHFAFSSQNCIKHFRWTAVLKLVPKFFLGDIMIITYDTQFNINVQCTCYLTSVSGLNYTITRLFIPLLYLAVWSTLIGLYTNGIVNIKWNWLRSPAGKNAFRKP